MEELDTMQTTMGRESRDKIKVAERIKTVKLVYSKSPEENIKEGRIPSLYI